MQDSPSQVSPPTGMPAPRPNSIMVLGILNLVFAAWGVFGALFFFAISFGLTNIREDLFHNQGLFVYTIVAQILGLCAALALGLSGIGLLMGKSWGRIVAILYSAYAIVAVLVSLVVTFVFVVGPMLGQLDELAGPEQFGAWGGLVGTVIGGVVGLIYPILLWYMMSRENVKNALT